MYYLDPKNDVTFKKVFGQHERILISFLNALLPLEPDQQVTHVAYLNTELLPPLTELKSTIVDIRCRDNHGRQFLVEMQMVWTDSFQSRVLFNSCKAYSHQINRGDPYEVLSPVYSLNIINDSFSRQTDVWYHHYCLSHQTLKNTFLTGLSFVFIELPNFIPANYSERRLSVLWLRFLKEIENNTSMIPEELLEVPEIAEAVEALKITSYTKEELEQYDKYWDIVRLQKSYVADAFKEGRTEAILETAKRLKNMGLPTEQIMKATGLSEKSIQGL